MGDFLLSVEIKQKSVRQHASTYLAVGYEIPHLVVL